MKLKEFCVHIRNMFQSTCGGKRKRKAFAWSLHRIISLEQAHISHKHGQGEKFTSSIFEFLRLFSLYFSFFFSVVFLRCTSLGTHVRCWWWFIFANFFVRPTKEKQSIRPFGMSLMQYQNWAKKPQMPHIFHVINVQEVFTCMAELWIIAAASISCRKRKNPKA